MDSLGNDTGIEISGKQYRICEYVCKLRMIHRSTENTMNTPKKAFKVDPKKLLCEHLVESAIDFIDHAIDDFDKSPKYSTIHFAAGIELFLKARLMHEHWSLIIQSLDKSNRQKIFDGDAMTVTPSEAKDRIFIVFGEDISEEWESFDKLIKHRNKMIHFYHYDLKDQKTMVDEKKKLASLQCVAWFQLYHGLLKRKWVKLFPFAEDSLTKLNAKMLKHTTYLKEKYEKIKDKIQIQKEKGTIIEECRFCHFEAAQRLFSESRLVRKECLVCNFDENEISIKCPECQEPIYVANYEVVECKKCKHVINDEKFSQLLDGIRQSDDQCDGYRLQDPICCQECDMIDVVQLKDGPWVCKECHTSYANEDIQTCDRCGISTTKNIRDSLMGFCDYCTESIMSRE